MRRQLHSAGTSCKKSGGFDTSHCRFSCACASKCILHFWKYSEGKLDKCWIGQMPNVTYCIIYFFLLFTSCSWQSLLHFTALKGIEILHRIYYVIEHWRLNVSSSVLLLLQWMKMLHFLAYGRRISQREPLTTHWRCVESISISHLHQIHTWSICHRMCFLHAYVCRGTRSVLVELSYPYSEEKNKIKWMEKWGVCLIWI